MSGGAVSAEQVRKIVREEKPFWRWLLLFVLIVSLHGQMEGTEKAMMGCVADIAKTAHASGAGAE